MALKSAWELEYKKLELCIYLLDYFVLKYHGYAQIHRVDLQPEVTAPYLTFTPSVRPKTRYGNQARLSVDLQLNVYHRGSLYSEMRQQD